PPVRRSRRPGETSGGRTRSATRSLRLRRPGADERVRRSAFSPRRLAPSGCRRRAFPVLPLALPTESGRTPETCTRTLLLLSYLVRPPPRMLQVKVRFKSRIFYAGNDHW